MVKIGSAFTMRLNRDSRATAFVNEASQRIAEANAWQLRLTAMWSLQGYMNKLGDTWQVGRPRLMSSMP